MTVQHALHASRVSIEREWQQLAALVSGERGIRYATHASLLARALLATAGAHTI